MRQARWHMTCMCARCTCLYGPPPISVFCHWVPEDELMCANIYGLASQAFRQRQEMSCHKDIDRRKVEHSIKEFVRATVHRLRDRR